MMKNQDRLIPLEQYGDLTGYDCGRNHKKLKIPQDFTKSMEL